MCVCIFACILCSLEAVSHLLYYIYIYNIKLRFVYDLYEVAPDPDTPMQVCVCVRARACTRVCVSVRMCVREFVRG
jgi:hypothetical protein